MWWNWCLRANVVCQVMANRDYVSIPTKEIVEVCIIYFMNDYLQVCFTQDSITYNRHKTLFFQLK